MDQRKGPKKGYKNSHSYAFGRKLYEVRSQKGFTQQQLAEKLGISVKTISFYERRVKSPTMDFIAKVSEALGVAQKVFLNESGTELIYKNNPQPIKSLRSKVPQLGLLPRKDQESLTAVIDSFLNNLQK